MKPVAVFTLFIILSTAAVQAQSDAVTDQQHRPALRQRIDRGIDALYSMNLDLAESIFDAIIAEHPKDPTGYFFRSNIYLWRYLFNKSNSDFNRFIAASEQTIDVGEDFLDDEPDDSFARALVGGSYGFRALANANAENFLTASWEVRQCYKYLGQTLKKDPRQFEAYLGMGIFQFVIGALPSAAQTVMNLVGLDGNTEKGIRLLEVAAERSLFARNDAKFILALLYVYFKGDYDKGVHIFKQLLERYPNNVPALYAMGNIEGQLRKMENAIAYFDRILNLADSNFSYFTTYAHFRRGEAYFRLNNFKEALRGMQQFVKGTKDKTLRATAYLRMGESYEFLGDRENAVKAYERAAKLPPVTPEDGYARRKAAEFAEQAIDEAQQILIQGANDVETHRFEQGQQKLMPLVARQDYSREIRAEAHYYIGEAQRQRRQYDEAILSYLKVIELQPERENWFIPWANFRLSQCYAENGDEKLARTYLDRSKVYSDYDFEEWLQFQIDRDLNRVK